MKSIDIVVPVYNEAEGVGDFNAQLWDALRTLSDRYRFRVIYVVDRCPDGTIEVLRTIAAAEPRVLALYMSRRFGHQMSLVAGLDHADADAVIMMDGDGQHPPSLVPVLLERFEAGFDVVQTVRQYGRELGPLRRLTSSAFYALQNRLSPVEIQDGMSDFRLVSRKVLRVFQQSIREQHQFLRGLFQWVGFNRTTVTFVSPPRAHGRTKYRVGDLFVFSIAGIVSFSKVPLRAAVLLGSGFAMLAVLYGAWLLWQFAAGGLFPPGYASLILVTLLMGGLQLMFLGLIGEYIGSIFDESKRRPLYIVDEFIGLEPRR